MAVDYPVDRREQGVILLPAPAGMTARGGQATSTRMDREHTNSAWNQRHAGPWDLLQHCIFLFPCSSRLPRPALPPPAFPSAPSPHLAFRISCTSRHCNQTPPCPFPPASLLPLPPPPRSPPCFQNLLHLIAGEHPLQLLPLQYLSLQIIKRLGVARLSCFMFPARGGKKGLHGGGRDRIQRGFWKRIG